MPTRYEVRALLAAAALTCVAAVATFAQDIKGSKDHPRISRFAGSEIVKYDFAEFGELNIPLSNDPENPKSKRERVEGKLTKILYQLPADRSSHEVFRSYETALGKAGFKTIFSCAGEQCGLFNLYMDETFTPSNKGSRFILSLANRPSQRYLVSKREGASEATTYVMLYALELNPDKYAFVNVVDVAPMKEGLVTISAEEMAKGISATGHVAIYGVYFDFDKADLKPESTPALQEMAKLLKQQPKLSVFIVGHTDNAGTLARNLELSQQRADAVVKALVAQHGIAAARLTARGVGPVAPIASNRSEDGRAKNRRVELVER